VLFRSYDAAEPLIEESVRLGAENPEVSDLERAAGLYELAKLYLWTNRAEESEELARRSLGLREQELGPDHPLVAQSLNALGNALQHLNRLDEAAATHTRAVQIREQAGPEFEEDLAASVHNLAIVHYFRGDLEAAEKQYLRAAEIELRLGGRDNHNYATTLHTLAIVYSDQERYDEALELELESLEIRESVLGPDHTHVGYSLSTLGELYRKLGRPAEGEAPGRRALEISKASQGVGHPETAWVRGNLVSTLLALDRLAEAEEVLQESLIEIESAGEDGAFASVYEDLGELRFGQGRLSEAVSYYDKAVESGRKNKDGDAARVGLSLAGLAQVMVAQKNTERADQLYVEALQVMLDGWGREDVDRQEVLADYVEFLKQNGNVEKANAVAAEG